MTSPPPPYTRPYLLDLSLRGFIEGLTHLSPTSNQPLCHYFGGLPYALPPVGPYRWRKPRPLPACYRYGHRSNPGKFAGGAALCPQPGFLAGPPDKTLFDEDCLQLNIWVPVGEAPEGGWPVFFFIHGGWLQFGTPNSTICTGLLSDAYSPIRAIVVCPAYRLNVFGFLASSELQEEAASNNEPCGNFGFWDQRLALEWTHHNISYFGGNAGAITVGGYSAGAHSTFHQLSHDIFHPSPTHRIIRRALILSNGPGLQPKPLATCQTQFTSLLSALAIPDTLSPSATLARLRAVPALTLVAAASSLAHDHEFRAWTDGTFVRAALFADLASGAYAARLLAANVSVTLGECAAEHTLYAKWRPPHANSRAALLRRLEADYPAPAARTLLDNFYSPDNRLPALARFGIPGDANARCADWHADAFGRIYADLQVHALQRGLAAALVRGGAGHLLRRYRVEWRAACVDAALPRDWGVTHSSDLAVWFWGNGWGAGLTEAEKRVVGGFLKPVARWIEGKEGQDVGWGADARVGEVRRLSASGDVDVWVDGDGERAAEVWRVATAVGEGGVMLEDGVGKGGASML